MSKKFCKTKPKWHSTKSLYNVFGETRYNSHSKKDKQEYIAISDKYQVSNPGSKLLEK